MAECARRLVSAIGRCVRRWTQNCCCPTPDSAVEGGGSVHNGGSPRGFHRRADENAESQRTQASRSSRKLNGVEAEEDGRTAPKESLESYLKDNDDERHLENESDTSPIATVPAW